MDGLSAEITVRVIGPIAYASDFADLLDPLGRLSVQQHWLTNSGLLLGAYLGDRPCGLAMMSFEHRCDLVADLPYLFVAEEYRRQGVGRALLAECIAAAKAKGFQGLRTWYAPDRSDDADQWLRAVLVNHGFVDRPGLMTTVVPLDRYRAEWLYFTRSKGSVRLRELAGLGYSTRSYADSDEAVRDELFSRMGTDFPSGLDPRNLSNPILPQNSFVTLKSGRPVAFCILSSVDQGKTAVLDCLAVSDKHRGNQIYLTCLIPAIDSLLAAGTKKLAYAYNLENYSLPPIVTSRDWFPGKTVTRMHSYQLPLDKSTANAPVPSWRL